MDNSTVKQSKTVLPEKWRSLHDDMGLVRADKVNPFPPRKILLALHAARY